MTLLCLAILWVGPSQVRMDPGVPDVAAAWRARAATGIEVSALTRRRDPQCDPDALVELDDTPSGLAATPALGATPADAGRSGVLRRADRPAVPSPHTPPLRC